MALVQLIDSGEYLREAADECYDSCTSTRLLDDIVIQKHRRTYLVMGMRMAKGKIRAR